MRLGDASLSLEIRVFFVMELASCSEGRFSERVVGASGVVDAS